MSLRQKTLLIISLTLIGLVVILYLVTRTLLLSSFYDIEAQDVRQNVNRVVNELNNELDNMGSTARDYASWDDTYEFIVHPTDEYVSTNLQPEVLANLHVNVFLYVDLTGRVVRGDLLDLTEEIALPFDPAIQQQMAQVLTLVDLKDLEAQVKGILLLPSGAMLVAARPILTSQYEGPARGILILGRYLSSDEIATLGERVHLDLNLLRLDDPRLPRGEAAWMSKGDGTTLVRRLTADTVSGLHMLSDVHGRPVLVLRVDMPRTIGEQGEKTLRYLVLWIIVAGGVFGLMILVLLERSLLARMGQLSVQLAKIRETRDSSVRITVHGQDELGDLGQSINQVLEALDHSQVELNQSQMLLKEIHHRIKNNLQVISSLLNLQAQRITDREVLSMFTDTRNRVRSMALVHERLYDSKDLARVDFRQYARDLTTYLRDSQAAEARGIAIRVQVEDVFLNIDQAVPCGLIINELVSNSFKHAFPDHRNGEICVTMQRVAPDQYSLVVSDSGVGLKPDFDLQRARSLGLQLVNSLTRQLQGQLIIGSEGGSRFEITFSTARPKAKSTGALGGNGTRNAV